MRREIFKILYKYSCEVDVKSSILKRPEKEEWLWAGDFDKVVEDISKLTRIDNTAELPKEKYDELIQYLVKNEIELCYDALHGGLQVRKRKY